MVNYSSLPTYVPTKLLRKDSSSRMSTASTASSSTLPDAMWATSGLSGGGFQTDYGHGADGMDAAGGAPGHADGGPSDAAYFHFSEDQQDVLLQEARANAAALVVDVLSDFDKWQFVTAKGPLNVFELRADAADRVSSMVPPASASGSSPSARPGASPLAHHMHTMLGMTRVRAKLDDFMRIFASARREAFQDVETCLFEDRVQLADVFTSFGALVGGSGPRRPSTESALSSSRGPHNSTNNNQNNSADDVDMEQYAIKYVSLKPVPSKRLSSSSVSSSSSASLSSSSSSLKFGSSRGARRRQRSAQSAADEADANQGLTLCLGEYATIRRGKMRAAPAADSLAASGRGHRSQSASSSSSSSRGNYSSGLDDHRIGIIAQHSMEDPAVTRYCKPIVLSSSDSSSSSSSSANASAKTFAFASRSLMQFSGLVVYPVASPTPGESLLEVLIKLSVYDPSPRGVAPATRLNMLAYVSAFQKLENALLVMRLRESPFLTSRHWVRSRARKCCYLCQAGFSSFRRKHHCRLCGEVTCSKCSDVHQIKLGRAGKCPFRICAQCVHGTDDALKLQRRRGSSNEEPGASPTQQPQDDEEDEDEEDGENDPSRRRDQFAPPQKGQDLSASSRYTGLDSSMRKMATSTSSNASTTSASSGSELFDSRGLLATSDSSSSNINNNRTKQGENAGLASSRTAAGAVTLTSLSVASSSASTVRSTTGSDQSPTRYGAYAGTTASSSASASSSPVSPGSAALSEDADSFYARFSEMSLMDFHDSEFDLSIKGMGGAMAGRPTGFEFDDSERGSDNELDDIGEEEDGDDADEFELDGREVDIDAMPLASTKRVPSASGQREFEFAIDDVDDDDDFTRESGMEFHDSEVGIEFDASEMDVDAHLGRLIDEEIDEEDEDLDDSDEGVDEVIETSTSRSNRGLVAPSHGSLAVLDQLRAARLAEYGILDSGKEHIYDVVARQAAQHLDCALATVSFVDARREYVKAGFGAPLVSHDVPKAHSLTAAIMHRCLLEDRDVVVVGDARADDLLSANKFVYEAPFVRFAVGVPVKAASDGTILGALVVADPRPRPGEQLSASQERMLRDLAEQVSALLEDRLARTLGSSGGVGAGSTAGPGQMREKLADLLSQSYHTGLQVQQNEHKILSSSGSPASLASSGSGAGALNASMLGGGSSSGALSAFMLGGSSSGSRFNASSSRFNASSSRFNPSGSRFDASASRITPKFHSQSSDDYSHMNGIEL